MYNIFPMSIDIKVKIQILLIFDLKTIVFPLDDAKVQILGGIYGLILFVKYLRSCLQKNVKGGSDEYKILCVEQLGRLFRFRPNV